MKSKNILIIAITTVVMLSIPLMAMQFTNEVNWTVTDFLIMGTLIFGAGLTFEWISSRGNSTLYRIAVGVAVLTAFLLTWSNLAVGIIGSDGNPANLMYYIMIAIGIVGAVIVRFRANGMSLVAFTMAGVQIIIPLIALVIWSSDFEPGVIQVFGINLFFALMFVVSAFLFKRAGNINSTAS